ncbi:response regulator [Georgenia sp. Z1344]|uniref:response regulator n=1 Tax=Georgenia sp. Z1344 TaxID=3416706 RepID=UPI003CFAAE45
MGTAETGTPLRVLVVDDDFNVASLHRSFVESTEHFTVVDVVHTGADAVARARELAPDLVLLDIYLPDISGLEVLRQLRQDGEVDVVVISAAREVETVRTAMAGGVLHYLVKPFTRADLQARLEDYLRHRRLVQDAATEPMSQEQVDRLLGGGRATPRTTTNTHLPKGLAQRTMEMVTEALREVGGPVSADDVAERVGMSRVAARRYLEHLAATGLAEVRPRFGRSGRPQHLYEATG